MKQIVDELGTRWTLDETERLQHAVSNNDFEIAKKYLEQGANPNGSNQYDLTPLMITALNGNLEMAKLLISKGADVNVKDKNGNTALTYCSNYGYIIIAKSADANVVKDKYGYIKIAKFLVENGADINHRNKDGITALEQALEQAAKINKFELAKFLIENGADHKSINKSLVIVSGQSDGWGISNKKEREEFLHYLISHNADVNAKNCIGVSALSNAVLVDNLEFAKTLLCNGANVNSKDYKGDTALMFACAKENWEITNLLIDNGANVNIKNNEGKTALEYYKKRCKSPNSKIVSLLQSKMQIKPKAKAKSQSNDFGINM